MKTKIEFITPKLAEKLLSKNCINRPVKKTTVDYYSDIIKRGQWELNGESIKISKEGILFWNNYTGWTDIKHATRFTKEEKRNFNLPLPKNNTFWCEL